MNTKTNLEIEKQKHNLAWATINLLSNNIITIPIYRVLAIIEGIVIMYYVLGIQYRIGVYQSNNDGKFQSNMFGFQLSFYQYTFISKYSEQDSAQQLALPLVFLPLYVYMIGIIIILCKVKSFQKIEQIKIKSIGRQFVCTLFVAFSSFLYIPLFEIHLRAFIYLAYTQNVTIKIGLGFANSIIIICYLIILLYCTKLFKLCVPNTLFIPWASPHTNSDYLQVVCKLFNVGICLLNNGSGSYIIIESIVSLALFISLCCYNIWFIVRFNRSIDAIKNFFEFLTTLVIFQSLLACMFQDMQQQEIAYVIVIAFFLTYFWHQVQQKIITRALKLMKEGKLKLELEYEVILFFYIKLVQDIIGKTKNIHKNQSEILSLLEWHQHNCNDPECICTQSDEYILLMRECHLQQANVIGVSAHQYKKVQNSFKKSGKKLVCNIKQMSKDIYDYQNENQEEEQLQKHINNNNSMLSIKNDDQIQLFKVDQETIKEKYITNFILILVLDIRDKFPQSQRIQFLVNYYSMIMMKKPQFCITQMRFFSNKNLSWIETQLLYINQLYFLQEFQKLEKFEFNRQKSWIQIDGEYFIKMNQLYQDFHIAIESLSSEAVNFWRGIDKNLVKIEQQKEIGEKIAFNIKNLYRIFKDLEEMKTQKDYKLYFWFAQVFLNILNDQEGYITYINKMKSILAIQKLIQQGPRYIHEDSGFVIVDASGSNIGKVICMNIQLRKFLGYSFEELRHIHINDSMPQLIADKHDLFMKKFNQTGESVIMNQKLLQFIKTKDGTIYPCELIVKFHYSQKYQYTFLSIIRPLQELAPFYLKSVIKTDTLFFLSIDNLTGMIYEVSKSFIKLINILENNYIANIHDLALNDKPKYIQEILSQFDFTQYIDDRHLRKKQKKFYEAIHGINLQTFNEFQCMNEGQRQDRADILQGRVAIFDEVYGNGNVEMSFVVIQLLNNETEISCEEIKQEDKYSDKIYDIVVYQDDNQSVVSSNDSAQSASSKSVSNIPSNYTGINQTTTPTSLKLVIQLVCLVFLVTFGISSLNLGLNIKRQIQSASELTVIQNSYELISLNSMNRLAVRILLNIANGYEPNNSTVLTDRFAQYQVLLYNRTLQMQSVQNFLDNCNFQRSEAFTSMINSQNVPLSYLQSSNTVQIQNQTLSTSINLYLQRLNEMINMNISDMQGNLYLQTLTPQLGTNYTPTQNEQTIFFTNYNGNGVLREQLSISQEQYNTEAIAHAGANTFQTQVTLVISIVTILVVGLVVSPIISKTEERKYMALAFFNKLPLKSIQTYIDNCAQCQNLKDPLNNQTEQQENQDNIDVQGLSELANQYQNKVKRLDRDYFNSINASKTQYLDINNIENESFSQQELTISSKQFRNQLMISQQQSSFKFGSNQHLNEQNQKLNVKNNDFFYEQDEEIVDKNKQSIKNTFFKKAINQRAFVNQILKQQELKNQSVNQGLIEESKEEDNEQILQQQAESNSIKEYKQQKIKSQALRAKIYSFAIVMLFMSIFSSYFVLSYFLAINAFTQSTNIIKDLDIVYTKDYCTSSMLSILRENQIRNMTMPLSTTNSTSAIDYLIDECFYNENQYSELRNNLPQYLNEAKLVFDLIESPEYCYLMQEYQGTGKECAGTLNDILDKGLSTALFYIIVQAQNTNINFKDALSNHQRDYKFLISQMEDPIMISSLDLKEFLVGPTFDALKQYSIMSANDYFYHETKNIVIIFGVFIALLLISLLLFLLVGFKKLRQTMWNTNLLLKIIPIEALDKNSKEELKRFYIR